MRERLKEKFDAAEDEFLRFDRIANPRHPRPDLCAFLMLHDLVPGKGDMISAAEHDEFYLDVDVEQLEKVATQEIVTDLYRCGVRYDSDHECLAMFA